MTIANELSTEKLLSLYKQMVRIRRFEDHVYLFVFAGRNTRHGSSVSGPGSGSCGHLRSSCPFRLDDFYPSPARPRAGKGRIVPRGAGGTLRQSDRLLWRQRWLHAPGRPRVGMLPAIAIVGGGNSVVAGLGLACKLQQTGQVAVCFFGEGATNEGAFHESLNFAAVQHLPIVFVCENNLYGASTAYSKVSLVEN